MPKDAIQNEDTIDMARRASRHEQATPTRWLITPHPADLSRVTHKRLVREYVKLTFKLCAAFHTLGSQRPFAASRMNVGSRITVSTHTDRHA